MASEYDKIENEEKSSLDNSQVETHAHEVLQDRPIKELDVLVSEIVERLEAGANDSASNNNDERKISTNSYLEPEDSSLDDILKSVEGIIQNSDPHNDNLCPLPSLNSLLKAAIASHSIAAYISSLDRAHLQKVNARINSDTTRWLTHMFRFTNYNAYYHHNHLDGLVKVTRMMLHYRYPRYLEDGALAFTNQLPLIYTSVASPLGVVQHLCRQLGLPLACIRPVPVNSMFGGGQSVDVAALRRMMSEDGASTSVRALVVVCEAGGGWAGAADDLPGVAALCRERGVWLHARGHTIAARAFLPADAPETHDGHIADSVTIPLGTWLGIPGLPTVTLYKQLEATHSGEQRASAVSSTREATLPLLAGLAGGEHAARQLPALPLWVTLRKAGSKPIVQRLRWAFEACALVWQVVDKMPGIRILSKQPGGDGGAVSLNELSKKSISPTLLLDVVVPCVVFQFIPEVPVGSVLGKVPAYYDKLNSWLGQILQRDAETIAITLCETDSYGVVLRYCPLESHPDSWLEDGPPSTEHLLSFAGCLEQQLDILLATVAHKHTFLRLVEEKPTLTLVELPGWAGLGGVRYVPVSWESLLSAQSPSQAQAELNRLNVTLVDTLRATDGAFSLGEGVDGQTCVRFGMVTAETDVEELLALVVSVGKEVEEQSKVLDNMTEIVKRGIEAATLDLQRETEERLWQEGILRRVPVFGRVVEWWSPVTGGGLGVGGRTLNLSQGTVESTENIYKYHMQIPSGTIPHGVTKAPPPAEIQTAVGVALTLDKALLGSVAPQPGCSLPDEISSVSHSRSSSQGQMSVASQTASTKTVTETEIQVQVEGNT